MSQPELELKRLVTNYDSKAYNDGFAFSRSLQEGMLYVGAATRAAQLGYFGSLEAYDHLQGYLDGLPGPIHANKEGVIIGFGDKL